MSNENEVKASVSSLYAALLSKRQAKKEMEEEQKRMEAELKEQEKADKEAEEPKLSKKEKRQKELDAWKEIVIGLTGDDLEYSSKKKNKKKYRKWIDDDDVNAVLTQKQKKPKKRNYNKEFEPELNMLRTLVAEQNRFTADLQKRFQNAAGPASKDAMVPNKTLVELASVIASGRSNSLGMLREIGGLKKTIAELYMKQKKLDSDLAGGSGNFEGSDLGLLGSSIASSVFDDSFGTPANVPNQPAPNYVPQGGNGNEFNPAINLQYSQGYSQAPGFSPQTQGTTTPFAGESVIQAQPFDPNSWEGPDIGDSYSKYESIPHTVVVEKDRSTGNMRFVAIKDEDGSEFIGCPVPTSDPTKLKVNETDMTVKGEFDEVYKLVYV